MLIYLERVSFIKKKVFQICISFSDDLAPVICHVIVRCLRLVISLGTKSRGSADEITRNDEDFTVILTYYVYMCVSEDNLIVLPLTGAA